MDYSNLDPQPDADEFCEKCDGPIEVMAFKGTGVCSDICRKYREGKLMESEWINLSLAMRHDLLGIGPKLLDRISKSRPRKKPAKKAVKKRAN